jgi:DNA-binding CsgD family transcriptional regulator
MIWKDIKGWKGQYQVNRKGQVKSLSRLKRFVFNGKERFLMTKEILLRPYLNKQGYYYYFLFNRTKDKRQHVSMARLIAISFIPNPKKKPEVNHKNCIRTDNRISNLEWTTRWENSDHSIKNSHYTVCKPGELNPAAKLTEMEVLCIRAMRGTSQYIADQFGVSRRTVGFIKKRQRWAHLK